MAPPARSGTRTGPSWPWRPLLVGVLAAAWLLPATALGARGAPTTPDPCLHIDRITAFAPRGEVYVELRAACEPRHFRDETSRLAYVEVMASDLPPVGEDVRVFENEPQGRTTLVFRDLSIASGDVVLVRLLRFGEILGLQSVRVP
jgi:hypothetical protein